MPDEEPDPGPDPDPGPREGFDALVAAGTAATGTDPVVARFALGTELGGPLDGVLAYPGDGHWLLVTFGLTELGAKRSRHPDVSGIGYELTMRTPRAGDTIPPQWSINVLNDLARRVRTGMDLGPNDWLATPGPIGGVAENAPLTGILVVFDPRLARLGTPNGTVDFLTVVGISTAEAAEAGATGDSLPVLRRLLATSPLLVTDPRRPGRD